MPVEMGKKSRRTLGLAKLTSLLLGLFGVILGILSNWVKPENAPNWLKEVLLRVDAAPWPWLAGFLLLFLFLVWLDHRQRQQAEQLAGEDKPDPTQNISSGRDTFGNIVASGSTQIHQTFYLPGNASVPVPLPSVSDSPPPELPSAQSPLSPKLDAPLVPGEVETIVPVRQDGRNDGDSLYDQEKSEIRELVKDDDLEQALEKLENKKALQMRAILLSGRLNRIKSEVRRGMVSQEVERIERARIAQAILEFISK